MKSKEAEANASLIAAAHDMAEHIRALQSELDRLRQQLAVPPESTPAMEQAAKVYWDERRFKAMSDDPRTWAGVWASMYAAAQQERGR